MESWEGVLFLAFFFSSTQWSGAQFVWPKNAADVMFDSNSPVTYEEPEFTPCLPTSLSSYHYGGSRESSGIYHRRVTSDMTYEEAKAFCEADGAHLATFRTQEEYQLLRKHSNVLKSDGKTKIWTSLENKQFNKCGPALSDCASKLTWGDNDTAFVYNEKFMSLGDIYIWNTDDGDYETYCSHMDTSTGEINDPTGGCSNETEKYASICQYDCAGPPAIGTIAQRNNFVIWGQDSSGVLCNWNTNGQHCPQRVVRNNWACDSALSENSEAIWLSPENVTQANFIFALGFAQGAAVYPNVTTLELRNGAAVDSGPCGVHVFQVLNYDFSIADFVPVMGGALKPLGATEACDQQSNQKFYFGPIINTPGFMFKAISYQPGATRACLQYLDVY